MVKSRLEPQIFSVLLLRRFWCPLPLSAHSCRCGRPLDVRGHHQAACGRAGVLGRRGFPLESAAAASAERQGGGFQSMYESLISTSFRQGGSITGRLRLWLMVCRSSTERTWQLMQLWCLPSEGTAVHVASVLTTMEQLCSKRDTRRSPLIQSCPPSPPPTGRQGAFGGAGLRNRWEMVRGQRDTHGSAAGALCWLAAASRFWNSAKVLAWMGRPHRPQLCLRSSDKSVRTAELAL